MARLAGALHDRRDVFRVREMRRRRGVLLRGVFTGVASTVRTKTAADPKTRDLAFIESYFPLRLIDCGSNERTS